MRGDTAVIYCILHLDCSTSKMQQQDRERPLRNILVYSTLEINQNIWQTDRKVQVSNRNRKNNL